MEKPKPNKRDDTKHLSMRKTAPIIVGIVVCAVALLFSILSIITAACDFSGGEIPYIFGWGICSSNGEYSAIGKNDAILVDRTKKENEIITGDVLVFYDSDARQLYAGEVISIKDNTFEMYVSDSLKALSVPGQDIRGVAAYSIGHVGYLISIVEGKYGMVLSIAAVVLLISLVILLAGDYVSAKAQRKVVSAIISAKEKGRALAEEMKIDEDEGEYENEMDKEEEDEEDGYRMPEIRIEPRVSRRDEVRVVSSAVFSVDADSKSGVSGGFSVGAEKEEIPSVVTDVSAPAPEQKEQVQSAEKDSYTPDTEQKEEKQSVAMDAPLAEEVGEEEAMPAIFDAPVPEVNQEVQVQAANVPPIPAASGDDVIAPAGEVPVLENVVSIAADKVPEPSVSPTKDTKPEVVHSFVKGGVFSERITMEIFSGEKDAQLLKKLIDMAAGKRSKFNIFTSVSRGEECALKVWCGWEDMPFVTSIINEFKKIKTGI